VAKAFWHTAEHSNQSGKQRGQASVSAAGFVHAMVKAILLLIFFGIAGWWFAIGGRQLNEAQVREFYRTQEAATLSRQPDALCELLDDRFQTAGRTVMAGEGSSSVLDKQQSCDGLRDLFASWEALGEKMGGMLQLDSHYTVHRITIAPDGHSATVDVSTQLDVGGSIMSLRSHTTDTLVRRNGRVSLLRSDGEGAVGVGG
jgi:hypothetical protein